MDSLPTHRAGEIIIQLRPDMIDRSAVNPIGLPLSLIDLVTKLRGDHGLIKVEPLWPIGVPLIQPISTIAMSVLPKRWRQSLKTLMSTFSTENIAQEGQISPINEWAARLRLRIRMDPNKPVGDALKLVLTHAGVEFAEDVPYRWAMAVEPDTKKELKEAFQKKAPPGKTDGDFQHNYGPDGYWQRTKVGCPTALPFALESIAVLDSGCDEYHPALQGAVDYGTTESRRDMSGHGTFVCGLLAARSQVAVLDPAIYCDIENGMLPKSKIWAMNIMDPDPYSWGGKLYYAVDPRRYSWALYRLASAAADLKVVNLSIGSGNTLYQTEAQDLLALEKAGIVVVASAGNAQPGAVLKPVMYPAIYPQVISVGAVAYPGDDRWPRTCDELPVGYVGKRKKAVDLWAPGEWVLSTLPMNANNSKGVPFSGWMHGTSMAAPIVTAAVAVLRHLYPAESPAEIRTRLREHCSTLTSSGRSYLNLLDLLTTEIAPMFPDGW